MEELDAVLEINAELEEECERQSQRIKELEAQNFELQRLLDTRNNPKEKIETLAKRLITLRRSIREYEDKVKSMKNAGDKTAYEDMIVKEKKKLAKTEALYNQKKKFNDKYVPLKTCVNCDLPSTLVHSDTGDEYCSADCYYQ